MSCDNPTDAALSQLAWYYCDQDSLSEKGLRKQIKLLIRNGITTCNFRYHGFIRIAGDPPNFHSSILHAVCNNEKLTDGMVRDLLKYFPDAAGIADHDGNTPLHHACRNKNVTLKIIKLLYDASPDSIRHESNYGHMPLHHLCQNSGATDDTAALEILAFLMEKGSEDFIAHADGQGYLPIHCAAWGSRSPEFCRMLIDAYPGSEQIVESADIGMMPFHLACQSGILSTVEFLYDLYPEANSMPSVDGFPIQSVIEDPCNRSDPKSAAKIAAFLLAKDPSVALQKHNGKIPFITACSQAYSHRDREIGVDIIKVLYDAYPEAIYQIQGDHVIADSEVRIFINKQLIYAELAKDHERMSRTDSCGRSPLNAALRNNVILGSVKLLAKANPSALQMPDNSGMLPLHVACEHEDSARVVQFLLGLDASTLHSVDKEGNTALHCACRSAKYDTISLLLGTFDAASVSKKNAREKLPIELLWESDAADRGSNEYTESIFCLLRAYPEMMTNFDINAAPQSIAKRSPRNEKKPFWKKLRLPFMKRMPFTKS